MTDRVLDDFVNTIREGKLKGNVSRRASSVSVFSVPSAVLVGIPTTGGRSTTNLNLKTINAVVESEAVQSLTPVMISRAQSDPMDRICIVCDITFDCTATQQLHCKSALHRSNLRRKMRGLPTKLAERDPAYLSDDCSVSSSSSNSDSSRNSNEEVEAFKQPQGLEVEDEGLFTRLGKPHTSITTAEGSVQWGAYHGVHGLQATFLPTGGGESQFSVNSLLLHVPVANLDSTAVEKDSELDISAQFNPWRRLDAVLRTIHSRPVWCVLILRSGKFAGAIFEGDAVLEHKVLRRYTRRAKAGGAQSSHDKKAGKARSAGAMMRRAGEEALKADVSALLQAWRGHLDAASVILVSVPHAMRSVLLEEEMPGAVLQKHDPRLLSVPFLVKQPTFAEAQAVHARCSTVVFTHINSEQERRSTRIGESTKPHDTADDALDEALTQVALQASLSGEQMEQELFQTRARERERRREKQSARERRQRDEQDHRQLAAAFSGQHCPLSAALFENVRIGDTAAVTDMLEALAPVEAALVRQDSGASTSSAASAAYSMTSDVEDLQSVLTRPDSLETLCTPLHVASTLGFAEVCRVLLEAGADPGKLDARGRTAYAVAKDKTTRDAFRRSRALIEAQNSFIWQWDAAGVGPALTEDAETARREAQKEKEKEKKRRAKQRKQEQAQIEEQVRKDAAVAQEMYEQEKQAAVINAVEAAGLCAMCGKSLHKVKAFALSDAKCCSADCVMKLRRRQAADAAERRMAGK